MTAHPQTFRLLAKRLGAREWLGLQHMTEGVDYQRIKPRLVQHIPEGEWIYEVHGSGFDYLHCKTCFPLGGSVIENMGQQGSSK